MSANFLKEDQEWIKSMTLQGQLTALEWQILIENFEQQTNFDAKKIKEELVRTKEMRKEVRYKLIMFPLTIVPMFLIFGPSKIKKEWNLVKIYYKFYKGKINAQQFDNHLKQYLIDDII